MTAFLARPYVSAVISGLLAALISVFVFEQTFWWTALAVVLSVITCRITRDILDRREER